MSDKKAFDRDSISNTLIVAIGLSLVCSVIVSSAAIVLKPVQIRNEELFRQQIILDVAGLMEPGADVDALFSAIETRTVDLESGTYADGADTEATIPIPNELDSAGIAQRAAFIDVYLVKDNGRVEQVILPVYGKGLWSTMLGYLAVAPDGNTIRGLRFYSHGETPGLGDQMDKESWRAQMDGKVIYGDDGEPVIRVIKGLVPEDVAGAEHMLDGMAGATLTGNGITGLLQYWTGAHGFGPYLANFREGNTDE
jgi:Na+-transporting NADH:ubiquinone oxidoreductase subunit C